MPPYVLKQRLFRYRSSPLSLQPDGRLRFPILVLHHACGADLSGKDVCPGTLSEPIPRVSRKLARKLVCAPVQGLQVLLTKHFAPAAFRF